MYEKHGLKLKFEVSKISTRLDLQCLIEFINCTVNSVPIEDLNFSAATHVVLLLKLDF